MTAYCALNVSMQLRRGGECGPPLIHWTSIMRSEIPGQLQKRSARRTIADKPDIQIEFRRQLQGSPYRRHDPSFVVAESAATETGEENNVRHAALPLQHSSPHRCFRGSVKAKLCKWLLKWSRNGGICDWKSGAEGLRYARPFFANGVGDFDVPVQSDAQCATQALQFWLVERAQISGDRIQAT